MDLPTYTNIWRIEKRLYKLYDLRLPMPLPIVWIGVFVGVLVPWSILLMLVRIPFDAPWHVLYLVPPGIVTWLSTRPVIESKRLNELLQSQVRYLGEPKAWCRLAPVDEPDEITFTARVWRSAPQAALLVSADTAKSASRARRGTRAKPRHTAPRRRPLEAWGPARQLPSVKAGARRGAVVPGEVRPAVAAAAAAVTTLPTAKPPLRVTETPVRATETPVRATETPVRVTETPVRVTETPVRVTETPVRAAEAPARGAEAPRRLTERPRLTWGAVATHSAPGLPPGTSSSPDASVPAPARALEPPRPTPDRVTDIPRPKAGRIAELPASGPEQDPDVPASRSTQGGLSATQAGPPVQEPATAETHRATQPAAPIGTEALRRLRRLAASAESRGPAASAESRGPATPKPQAATPEPELRTPQLESATPEPEADTPEAGGHAAAGHEATAGHATSGHAVTAGHATEGHGTEGHATEGHAGIAGVSSVGGDPDAETELREQHRKGQPPRPAAYTRLPEARTVWPVSPSRTPETPVPADPGQTAPKPLTTGPVQSVSKPLTTGPVQPVSKPKPAVPRSPVRPAAGEHGAPPVSIRAVPGPGTTADPAAPSVPVPVPRTGDEPRVRRVESVVGRDQTGGWRRLAQVVVGGGGPNRNDGIETDEARARTVLTGSRRIVVLGCTGGAGQTTTTLMLGHTLARYREDRVIAVDANTGDHTLTGRIPADSPETLTSLLSGLDGVSGYLSMRAYTTRCESGLEVVASDADTAAARRLADQGLFSDQRLAQAMRVLDRHYRLILVDPAAAVAARMLPYADQLILVAPASEDAPDAVAMTFDWLDGHGSTELRRRAIMVINGVSRRSMGGVEQAEAVARGRCRAIVRVPWEDELAPGQPGHAQLTHLRAGGRRAYVALAGVVASGLAAASRPSEEEVAQ
ncbi:TcpE family conjugal transfer membrane protein [Sphaerisporangium viridialbum]|uniref:TcpE family conjugal transfer membrane protein n=1 Tax=Sphaerisporangium viridialbum TaxID=46189 RepID=UPI003C73D334